MPVIPELAAQTPGLIAWRQQLHAHPELAYREHATAAFVAGKLRSFGLDEVHTGIGRTGVVGVLHGVRAAATAADGRIALRADMDALPILEAGTPPHVSTTPGVMHACGHDGHTTMLLAAARHLAATRRFDGTALFIFQPAEEDGAGAAAMLADGLFERWPVRAAFGLHNDPGLPVGRFGTRTGPFLGSTCEFYVTVTGRGAHAAEPHSGADPIVALAQIVVSLQTAIARNAPPSETAVLTVTRIEGGGAINVIPAEARFEGTIRCFSMDTQALLKRRLHEIAEGVATAMGCRAQVRCEDGYPVLVNDAAQTDFAVGVARGVAGDAHVNAALPMWGGAEDFAFIAQAVPSAFLVVGTSPSQPLHHPEYDFNDAAIPYGASYWVRLVERALPL